jgi:preprotein translocase subunit SecF
MRRLFAEANYDFIGLRQRAYVLSATAIILGLCFAILFQATRGSWLNYGVDFAGGTLIQVRFDQPMSAAELRPVIGAIDPLFENAQISRFGSDNEFLIRTASTGESTSGAAEMVPDALEAQYGAGTFDIVLTEAVGAKVGTELQARATLAILLSFMATLVYLALRFEWRFGLAAVIATVHDILLTLALISSLQLEVALPTVAAVLTIVGYSLNDTIVIFDRIRENLRIGGRRVDFIEVLNRSINETLPRTVVTSATTLVTLMSLFIFGGAIIRDFTLIMIFGIILGTYSSIFVASPALLVIERRWPGDRKKARIKKNAKTAV